MRSYAIPAGAGGARHRGASMGSDWACSGGSAERSQSCCVSRTAWQSTTGTRGAVSTWQTGQEEQSCGLLVLLSGCECEWSQSQCCAEPAAVLTWQSLPQLCRAAESAGSTSRSRTCRWTNVFEENRCMGRAAVEGTKTGIVTFNPSSVTWFLQCQAFSERDRIIDEGIRKTVTSTNL